MAYPPYQPTENAYQIAGRALQQGASVADKMAALIEKRKQNLIQQRRDEIEAQRKEELRRREDEKYRREQEALKRMDEFREKIASGKDVRAEGPPTPEGEYPTTVEQYTPDEIIQEGLRSSVVDPLEYAKIKNKSETVSRMQKFPGDDGYMKVFDPLRGTATDMIDEVTGERIKAQDYYRLFESEDGVVPISTRRPPEEAPEPIKNLTPAGKKKRDLQTVKIIEQLEDMRMAQDRAKKGGQYKGNQYEAAGYGKRMEQSGAIIDRLIADPEFNPDKFGYAIVNNLPNYFKSSKLQQLQQAMRNFVNATLRRESGAAIAQSEFDNATEQYFPRPGDSPEVIKQKTQNRQTVYAMMKAEAGGAWDELEEQLKKTQKPMTKRQKQLKAWAKKNPNDPRAKAILQKFGD